MHGALMVCLVLAATGPLEAGPPSAPWDGESYRRYVDASAGVAFSVPLSGFLLEARHFDASTSAEKLKHLFTLSGPNGPEVTVDVWVDRAPADSWRFLLKHLAFMKDEQTSLASVVVSSHHVPGTLLAQPRSGQSYGHLSAVFAVGARIFRVTCLDKDDLRARKVFEQLLASFDAEVQP